MTHPFDGVTPEVTVEGVQFVLGEEGAWYAENNGDLGLDVFLGCHSEGCPDYDPPEYTGKVWSRDYSMFDFVTGRPTFDLSTPEGFKTFRAHLRATRGRQG